MRCSLLARLALIVTGLVAVKPAVAAPDAPKVIGKLAAVETFALPNGLQVAVLPDDVAPVVSVQVWYHAGSKDEPRDRRGEAHMFERMMFKGTVHVRPDAHAQSISEIGGHGNARIDEDASYFVDTLPAAFLDYAIHLEAERMRNLLLRPAMIDAVREVVRDELRQQDASAFARGILSCLAVAYLKHPYAWTAAGNLKDLDAISADDLRKFYDTYYQPGNAMLVVVGKVTTADVKASAERWFGAIPKASDPPRPAAAAQEPAQTTRRREVAEPGPVGMTLVGWHLPPAKDPDIHALQVAAMVLGASEGSRLKQRLKTADPKTKQVLAFEAGMDMLVREDPGFAVAFGAYRDPAQADAVLAAILDEIGKLATRGPTADELRRAKNQAQSGFVFSLDNVQGLGEIIGRSWIFTGNPGAFMREVDEVEKVSIADIQRVVKQYLSADRTTVVVVPQRVR